jgi:hypothetical protein
MIINCKGCGQEHQVQVDTWPDDEDSAVMMYNSVYGCDSGCEYVRFEVSCKCGHKFDAGEFGSFDDNEEANMFFQDFLKEYNG